MCLPNDEPNDVFALCTDVKPKKLRADFLSIRPIINSDATAYIAHGKAGTLNEFPSRKAIRGVSHKKLKANYSSRLLNKDRPERKVYNRIKLSAHRCPYCDVGKIKQVDHFLPQALYSSLIVNPYNLVPTCRDCNFDKLDIIPNTPADVVLHPYFDDVSDEVWLSATLIESAPASIQFSVVHVANYSDVLNARIRKHFEVFDLAETYSVMAASELSAHNMQYGEVYERSGAAEVKDELLRTWRSKKSVSNNSWQTAAYHAFANSDWYCDGGFLGEG